MATLRKGRYTIPVPDGAKILTQVVAGKEERFAQFKHRGKTIRALLVGDGSRCRVETDFWYIRFHDSTGWHEQRSYTDKRAAEKQAREIQERIDRGDAGVDPCREQLRRPLAEHVREWRQHLRNQGKTPEDTERIVQRVTAALVEAPAGAPVAACGFATIADIRLEGVEGYLAARRSHPGQPMSVATHNYYVMALRRFSRWLVDDTRAPRDPLARLRRMKLTDDRIVRPRRDFSLEEVERLYMAALAGPVIEGVTGPERALLYVLGAWTGLRRGELASLTARSFDLDAAIPTVNLPARSTKSKKPATIPLHANLVEPIRAALASLPPGAPLFPLRCPGSHWFRKTSKMVREDLAAARKAWIGEGQTIENRVDRERSDFLTYRDEAGLYADLHSLRHSFVSGLARGGVSLVQAQKLARHSDPRLTSTRYAHLELADQAAAIARLPAPPAALNGRPAEPPTTADNHSEGLRVVADAWSGLSDATRAAILALVHAGQGA